MADEIEIVDYDTSWPRLFEEERALLGRTLPTDQVLAVEHAGSTAIPDLAEAPRLRTDIVVGRGRRGLASLQASLQLASEASPGGPRQARASRADVRRDCRTRAA